MKKIINTAKEGINPGWLLGGNPSAIELQEKTGQRELITSNQLPVSLGMRGTANEDYEKMGIRIIGETEGDNIFFDVELPQGWKIQPTEHPMWSELVDSKGRIRSSIFYKAVFYDRSAHVRISHRYEVHCEYEGKNKIFYHIVKDNETNKIIFGNVKTSEKDGAEFLNKAFPDWRNPHAYWT